VFVRAGDLFVVGVDGKGLHDVSNDPSRIDDAPDWSPDGTRIAFAGDPCFTDGAGAPQGGPCVFVMNADGSGTANLTPEEKRLECDPDNQNAGYSHAHHSDDPSWSPDGSKIAFTGYFDICTHSSDGATDIWVMNADGSGKKQLTSTPNFSENPNWSPDGNWIVFDSDRGEKGNLDVYKMHPDGSGVTQLTDSPALDALPAFSPDGTKIVFVSDRAAKDSRKLFVMSASGGNQTRLINASGWTYQMVPDWQPISKPDTCTIRGTIGSDHLAGTSRNDVICGLGGDDVILGGAGNDVIQAGPGNDVIRTGPGHDTVYCGAGRDTVHTGPGHDTIHCARGNRVVK
jgi:Tol biopolymer transport system component